MAVYLYYGVIVGIGFTALGFIPHVALMARWFGRRAGLPPVSLWPELAWVPSSLYRGARGSLPNMAGGRVI